jgi:hypothetical protein
VAGPATLCGEEETAPQGLTDACRSILKSTESDLTPTDVRDSLEQSGFDLGKYENPLAVIHTTLKRLAEQGEVTIVLLGDARGKSYRWTRNSAPKARDAVVLQFLDEFVKKRA